MKPVTLLITSLCVGFTASSGLAAPAWPKPPVRDPANPDYVTAAVLPDGAVPPSDREGNYVLGPTHPPAPELVKKETGLKGSVRTFTLSSSLSRFYPGVMREAETFGVPDPGNPAKLIVTTSHAAPYERTVTVYIPPGYVPGVISPFIVGADGPDPTLFQAIDGLIAEGKLPSMIAISVGNGGGDAQGSERGLEYDVLSPRYADFVEAEILPEVEKRFGVRLSKDPEARATTGGGSAGSASFIMAWFHPELYHRTLVYSGTFVNHQWPFDPALPGGAYELPSHLVAETPSKPLRIWMEVGDSDLYNPNIMRDGMHDWVEANEKLARSLAYKGYDYQFVFARNATHVDPAVVAQTLPEALQWLWRGYKPTTR